MNNHDIAENNGGKGLNYAAERQKMLERIKEKNKCRLKAIVYLVIDRSGSMSGEKMDQAIRGTLDFSKEAIRKRYSVGLILFSDSAEHVCAPTNDLGSIESCTNDFYAGGGTDMASALRMARQEISGFEGVKKVIVLVTDGQPDSKEDALSEAAEIKRKNIDIITIGTDDADGDFLKKIATRTDLSFEVESAGLKEGIASTAGKLPMLGGGI